MVDVLNVETRDSRGSRNARRLRQGGRIPAVLYGHGKDTVALAVSAEEVSNTIRHGIKFVSLKGAVSESALISEVQWDPFGSEVLHIDLTRASAGESAEVTVPVTLKGTAPGTREGGVVEHLLHTILLDCPVTAIPEQIEVNINRLELTQAILVSDLQLPTGAKAIAEDDAIVVQCVEAQEELDEEAADDLGAEPEVIGRKPEDEQES